MNTKTKLTMDFDARDVIDVLVSERESDIESQIQNLTSELETVNNGTKQCDVEIEEYKKEFVKNKFGDKILIVSNAFKDIGVNATVRIEIIDGCDLPNKRRSLSMNPEYQNRENKIIAVLIICNKDADCRTVDGSISFYLESDYDEILMKLKNKDEELGKQRNQIKEKITKLESVLSKTDMLTRRAKAEITKKMIPDMKIFLEQKNDLIQLEMKK